MFLIVVFMVLVCFGIGDQGEGGGFDDLIVIGIFFLFIGDFLELGKGVECGYEVWCDIVNENGGFFGWQVELKIFDDQFNVDWVVFDYELLIVQDGVDFVFGLFFIWLVVLFVCVVQEYGMFFVELVGVVEEVFEQGFDNFFYVVFVIVNDYYNNFVDYLLVFLEDQCLEIVVVVVMDDFFVQGMVYGFRDKLEEVGVEIFVNEVYLFNIIDFFMIVVKIVQFDVDIVIGGIQYQDVVNLIIVLQQLNYQFEFVVFFIVLINLEFVVVIGGVIEGIFVLMGYLLKLQFFSNVEFVEKYIEMYGNLLLEDEVNVYMIGQVVVVVVEVVGCVEQGECQQEFIDWLCDNEVEIVVGFFSWDEMGKFIGVYFIQQWIDGEILIVFFEDVKEVDFFFLKLMW